MDDTALLCRFPDLLKLLDRDEVPHEATLDSCEVVIPTKQRALDSLLLIRWQVETGTVQFIQPLPFEIPLERLPAVETAVCRLNPMLLLPGFEIEYNTRRVGYRTVLSLLPRGGVLAAEVQAYFRVTVKTAADFFPVLARVADGLADPLQVVRDAQAELAEPNPTLSLPD